MKICFFGSSLVSSYWNGAATYYRGIIRALAERPVATLGILGCGRQGRAHLELAREVLPDLAGVLLFDRHRERAELGTRRTEVESSPSQR